MFYSPISSSAECRRWIAHGDTLPGSTPVPLADHDEVRRFGGSFVRPLYSAENVDDLRQWFEQPFAVVSPTADPHTIKRSYRAVHTNRAPFPDFEDAEPGEDFHRPVAAIDPGMRRHWRRI